MNAESKMSTPEYLCTTCDVTQNWSACLWDHKSNTGNVLHKYTNGGTAVARTLNQIGNSYILTADQAQPLLHIWPLNSQEQIKDVRLVLPAIASVATVSPDNAFLAVGIGTKLYTWMLCNGKLLSVQEKHLQPITCIKFSANSDYLLTTSQDGTVLAYNFVNLVCRNDPYATQNQIGQVEPVYSCANHTLAITDLHVGNFGLKSRFITVSLDCTCRVYDLFKGQPLLQLVFDKPLSCVTVDSVFWNLFVGTNSGLIQQFRLHVPPRTFTHHVSLDDTLNFSGHTEKITCLDLNLTDTHLVSGSEDRQVFIWNVQSRQILNRIEHKGGVTNVKFLLWNTNLFEQNFKSEFVLKSLQRAIDDGPDFTVSVLQDEDIVFTDDEELRNAASNKKIAELESRHVTDSVVKMQLYQAMLKKLFNKNE